MQQSFRGHNLRQAGIPTLTDPQSCHAASWMGCARISRKHKCQQAWYGCKESDVAEHPVMPQPDPGRDGYFLYRQHHHQMRYGPPIATVYGLLLAFAVHVLPPPCKAMSTAAFYSRAEMYDTMAQSVKSSHSTVLCTAHVAHVLVR